MADAGVVTATQDAASLVRHEHPARDAPSAQDRKETGMAGNRRTRARVVVILLGILASLLAPTAAEAASETPFRAQLTGQAMFTPTSTPGVLANTVTGEGLASHLGRVEVSVTEIIDLTSGAVVQ